MANNISTILRRIFLGSLAGITASSSGNAKENVKALEQNENEKQFESAVYAKRDLSPKLILKKTRNNELEFVSHRSHRSHQSHRSHYSSYSGGESEKSTPKSNPNLKPNYNKSISDSSSHTDKLTNSLQLGSRKLSKGMSGTDVTELVNILLRKEYLKLEGGGTQVTGTYIFDEIVEGAVMKFQSDNGLKNDGVCDFTTIYYLKNK